MLEFLQNLFSESRRKKAMGEELNSSECVACDSSDVTSLGPDAYKCNQCGYQGGSGLAAMHESKRLASFDAMDPAERAQSAVADFREAESLLIGCQGSLAGARNAAVTDYLTGSQYAGPDGDMDEKQGLLTSVYQDYDLARRAVKDAAYKLQLPGTVAEFEGPGPNVAAWKADLWNVDFPMFAEIESARLDCETLLLEVQDILATF